MLIISLAANTAFAVYFGTNNDISKNITNRDISKETNSSKYELHTSIDNYQLFYGTWKIIEIIPCDFDMPSRYYRSGPNYESVLGVVITFKESYVEYEGEKYELVYGFRTYTHKLSSNEDKIGYNYAKTLGITGNYYSIVYFVLPDNQRETEDYERDYAATFCISDLCFLYLKDNNTIYATDGGLMLQLERITNN